MWRPSTPIVVEVFLFVTSSQLPVKLFRKSSPQTGKQVLEVWCTDNNNNRNYATSTTADGRRLDVRTVHMTLGVSQHFQTVLSSSTKAGQRTHTTPNGATEITVSTSTRNVSSVTYPHPSGRALSSCRSTLPLDTKSGDFDVAKRHDD